MCGASPAHRAAPWLVFVRPYPGIDMNNHLLTVAILLGAILAYWFGFAIASVVALVVGIALEIWFYIRVLRRRDR